MTIGSHQRTIGKSQVAITPRWILDPLGPFDLDPCGNNPRPWNCAATTYTEADDGLKLPWFGRAFVNPEFHRYRIALWINRLVAHGRGVLLTHGRTDTEWFKPIRFNASAILFLAGRVIFHQPNGDLMRICDPKSKHFGKPANSGAPVLLAAFGWDDADALCLCGLDGLFVPLRIPRSVIVEAINESWRAVVTEWLRMQRGPIRVADLYRAFAEHPKARRNRNWRPKLRQTLLRGAGKRVAHDQWVAA
jgi:hypothetical protein